MLCFKKLLQLNRNVVAAAVKLLLDVMHYGHLNICHTVKKKHFPWLNEIFDTCCIDIIYGIKIFDVCIQTMQQFLF